MRVAHRVTGGLAVLLTLFLAVVVAQFLAGNRLDAVHEARAGEISQLRDDNRALLQSLTDAETGIRGFQLTGDAAFLTNYETGRAGALGALDRLAAEADDPVRELVAAERDAATRWLYGYAIPIVNAGVADADPARLARGEALFERVRATNAEMHLAIDGEWAAAAEEAEGAARTSDLIFAGLALLVVLAGLGLAALHQRYLLAPLETMRRTMRRLAAGDLTARAVPSGPRELRAVADDLNDLASVTERLVTEEHARAAANDLREAIAAVLCQEGPYGETSRNVVTLIGRAFGAEAVHARVTVRSADEFTIAWPAGTDPLDEATLAAARRAGPGRAFELPGALAVSLSGDAGCPPGLILVSRPGRPEWTAQERWVLEAIGRDIDHEVRQQRLHLRHTRLINELRVLDEQKDAFVSTVTHELRTPLTSILGYTEMLADGEGGDLSPIQQRGVTAILRNAHRLEATVADLLVLDRSNERVGVEAVPVDLAALAAGLHADLGPATRAKALDSELAVEPAWVRGVGPQLQRALRNLLENAIKFTPAGGRLECRLTADEQQVVITVTDTGIGIPPADVPGLFTPFHRATNAMDQAVQGSGLGLAIVRNIVTEHGGTVTASSELGRGSTFTVTLPALPAAAS